MSESQLLTMAGMMVAAMFGILTALLGWAGNRIYQKLDEMAVTMHAIASELHNRINGLDRRVTVVETKCGVNHGGGNQQN